MSSADKNLQAENQLKITSLQSVRKTLEWGIQRGGNCKKFFFEIYENMTSGGDILPTEKRIRVGPNGSSVLIGYRQFASGWKIYYYYV
jgi:hypothetical protein